MKTYHTVLQPVPAPGGTVAVRAALIGVLLATCLPACANFPGMDGSAQAAVAPSGSASGEADAIGSGPGPNGSRREVQPDPAQVRITVSEAVHEALEFNRGVLQARLATAIGGTVEREARSALLPTVGARARHTRLDQPPRASAPELGTSFTVGPKEINSFAVELAFPIYGFGRHFHNYRAAQLARKRDEAERESTESDVAAAVTAAAFDLLEGAHNIDVARSSEQALEQQVRDAQALLDAGRVTRVALLEAQVEHDRARRGRERLETAIPILRMTLNGLLGRDPHAPTEVVDDPATQAPVWEAAALEDEAVVRRAELRAARLNVAALERGVRAARGRELPELRGSFAYDVDDNRFSNPKDTATFALTLDVPILTGGGRGARIQRARYQADVARLAVRDLEVQVRTEVAARHRDVVEAFRDIEVARRSIERAEESLRIQREKFRNGRATSREVLDSNTLLTDARFQHVRAVYNYNVALRELHRARGADPRQTPLPDAGPAAGTTPGDADTQDPAAQGGTGTKAEGD